MVGKSLGKKKIEDILISVIVITYNSADTVIDTLESIRNQTYENIELVISDDCSTDGTVELIKQWLTNNKSRFSSCKLLVARKNHGVTKNCNIGAFKSSGTYIQFVAGDDTLHYDAMEKKLNFAINKNLDFVISKVNVSGVDNNVITAMRMFCENGYIIIKEGRDRQWNEIIYNNFIAGPSGAFYRKSFFDKQGGYDIRFPMLEDYPFIFKFLKQGNEIVLLDEELEDYYLTDKSLCTSGNIKCLNSSFLFFISDRLIEMIKKRDIRRIFINLKEFLYYYIKHFFPKMIEEYENNKIRSAKLCK